MKIFNELYKDLKKRDKKGFKSYGKEMITFDGRDSLEDLFEELLDALVYLKKLRLELNKIGYGKNIKSQTPKRKKFIRVIPKKSWIHRKANKGNKKIKRIVL